MSFDLEETCKRLDAALDRQCVVINGRHSCAISAAQRAEVHRSVHELAAEVRRLRAAAAALWDDHHADYGACAACKGHDPYACPTNPHRELSELFSEEHRAAATATEQTLRLLSDWLTTCDTVERARAVLSDLDQWWRQRSRPGRKMAILDAELLNDDERRMVDARFRELRTCTLKRIHALEAELRTAPPPP